MEKNYIINLRKYCFWEETENMMKKHEERLRVGTMISMGGTQISQALNKLYQTYPNLSVTLKQVQQNI